MNDDEMHKVQGCGRREQMEQEELTSQGDMRQEGMGFSEKRVYSQTYILDLLKR
jgi:hypothetical protein